MSGSDYRPGPPAEAQSFPRRGFYGRKHGRRLRSGLKQLLEDLLPRLRIALPEPGQTVLLISGLLGLGILQSIRRRRGS